MSTYQWNTETFIINYDDSDNRSKHDVFFALSDSTATALLEWDLIWLCLFNILIKSKDHYDN